MEPEEAGLKSRRGKSVGGLAGPGASKCGDSYWPQGLPGVQ